MTQFLYKFGYITKGNHKALSYLLFLFLLISFLELLGISLVGPFISVATNPSLIKHSYWFNLAYEWLNFDSDRQFLLMLGLFVIVIFYVKSLISFSAQKSIFEFGFRLQAELMHKLLHVYLGAPYTFHLSKNSSSIIQNIITETSDFCNGLTMPLLTSISNGVVISALIFLLIKTNVMAMVIILGILAIAFTMFYFFKDRLARWGKESSESHTEMIRLINHSLGGLKETRIIGCESYFENQMILSAGKFQSSAAKALGFSNLPRYMIEAFFVTFLIGFTILFVTINQGKEANLTSVLGIFALASIRLLPAVGNLSSAVNGMRYKSYSLDRIYLDLNELEDINQNNISNDPLSQLSGNRGILSFSREILLDKVTYRYPNASKNSLEGVSLSLKKGESIGLIGKSGAGKTTLVDVILGLLQPESGDIKVDDKSIYEDLRSWQDIVGYVPQSIFLIDDTLERNIAFGVPDNLIDGARLSKAIQSAQLLDLVEQLPDGIHTRVGERGVLLSGGQRQRVGIARVLYHEREILVFDEATAALDNETEALVTESIRSLSGVKTMIIIAHRLSTIEHCDRIYMLKKGQVIKSGSYREVILNASI